MNKIFSVYKPKGPTSNQMLNKIKVLLHQDYEGQASLSKGCKRKIPKVGHAGTLDPLASGILVVGIGREATKKLRFVLEGEKEYIGMVKLGETSETDDEEGIPSPPTPLPKGEGSTKLDDIKKILPKFIGSSVWQMPPKYSAIKAGGKKAYEVARQGGKPLLGPRQVEIKEIEILKYKWPYLEIRVVCGSGTYIRSLARDIGEELGVGGYLSDLERIRVGDFEKSEAVKEEDLEEFLKDDKIT